MSAAHGEAGAQRRRTGGAHILVATGEKLSRSWNADYDAGVDLGEDVGNARRVGDSGFFADGDIEGATVGIICDDDVSDARDDVEGRNLEIPMSETSRTTVPIDAAIPPTFAQKSVFSLNFVDWEWRSLAN